MQKTKRARAGMAALALTALIAAPALAQDSDWQAQMRRYLDARTTANATDGFRRDTAIADMTASFGTDSAKVFTVNLRRGVDYRIIGVCDDDCTDVDMEVYGADGLLAGRDVEVNDIPVLNVTGAGSATVRVWLANCETEPCAVGVRVLRK
jgi:hypothetical protein